MGGQIVFRVSDIKGIGTDKLRSLALRSFSGGAAFLYTVGSSDTVHRPQELDSQLGLLIKNAVKES